MPSSPYGPWSTGNTTSTRLVDSAVVGSIGCRAVLSACRWTSAAESAFGTSPVNAHRPSLAILIGTASYFAGSRCLKIAAADAMDTSCSPDRPP